MKSAIIVAVTCSLLLLTYAAALTSPSCQDFDNKVISNTEDDPDVKRDKIGCSICYCDNGTAASSGQLPTAVCLFGDCATARCVMPVLLSPKACCKSCPEGENCYATGPQGKRRIIKMNVNVRVGGKTCHCNNTELNFGEPYNKQAICTA